MLCSDVVYISYRRVLIEKSERKKPRENAGLLSGARCLTAVSAVFDGARFCHVASAVHTGSGRCP